MTCLQRFLTRNDNFFNLIHGDGSQALLRTINIGFIKTFPLRGPNNLFILSSSLFSFSFLIFGGYLIVVAKLI